LSIEFASCFSWFREFLDKLAAKRSAQESLSGGTSPKNARLASETPPSITAAIGELQAAAKVTADANASGLSSLINFNTSNSETSEPPLSDEKKSRREIANCNERRRMQSINDGFVRLKSLVPCIAKEKVSKATILQQTAEHIEKDAQAKVKLQKIILSFDPNYVFDDDLKSGPHEVSGDIPSLPTMVEKPKPIPPTPDASLLAQLPLLAGNSLDKTRQMLIQIAQVQLISQLGQNTAPYNPLIPEQTPMKPESADIENNENNPILNTLLQTMLQNLAQDSAQK